MSRPIHTDSRVLRPIIEALIFASEEPLAPRLLVRLLAGERDDPKSTAGLSEDADPESSAVAAAQADAEPSADAADETTFPDEALRQSVDADGALDVDAGPVASNDECAEVDAHAEEDEGGEEDERAEDSERSGESEEVGDATIVSDGAPAPDEASAADMMRHADASESPDALASAYVDLSRDFSERLFPEEQIVTIDQRLVRRLIDDLNAEYEETGRAFRIVEVAGGFQFATIRDFGEYVALLSKEKQRRRLSPAALETLAIIAFRQPISKPEIEAIRGVNSDQVLLSLLEKNLVAITGRSESVGRPLLYGTTDEFLRIFGLNSLNELPKLREIEELMEEDAYSAERIEVVTVDRASDAEQIEAIVGAAGAGPEDGEETGPEPVGAAPGEEGAVDAAEQSVDAGEVAEDIDELGDTFAPVPGDAAERALEEAIANPDGVLDESPELMLGDRSDYDVDAADEAVNESEGEAEADIEAELADGIVEDFGGDGPGDVDLEDLLGDIDADDSDTVRSDDDRGE